MENESEEYPPLTPEQQEAVSSILTKKERIKETEGDSYAKDIVISIFSLLLSIHLYSGIIVATPEFQEIMDNFGADIPFTTTFFLAVSKYFICLVVIGVYPTIKALVDNEYLLYHKQRFYKLHKINLIVAVISVVIFLAAAYLPVFKLGSVV